MVNQTQISIDGNLKYWVRFRVTSALTADGTNEQVKLHTNRLEVGEDGFVEHFGGSIYKKDLIMHWGLSEELSGFSPQNQTINFASGISLVYLANKLNNNQTSGRGGIVEIPEGMDTSRPLDGEVLFIPLDDNGGDILFQADTYQTQVGDALTTGNTPESVQAPTTITAGSINKLHKIIVPVNVQNLTPGEILSFGIKRVGGDVLDTYGGDISIVNLRAIGSFWKP